jgi:hypothetical protein
VGEEHNWRSAAHKRCIRNRAEIEASDACGCFYCKAVFPAGEIDEWTDIDNPRAEQTALCPRCGIDSVIGDKAGFRITPEFLDEMHRAYF